MGGCVQSTVGAWKKKSRSSRLLTLVLAVALLLAVVSVSIPNLLRSRIAANEASAVGSIRTINTAIATYSEQHPGEGYPQKLSDLAPYVDSTLVSGEKSGYSFRYEPQTDAAGVVRAFQVKASPTTSQTGVRSFSSNESGAISYTDGPSSPERTLDGTS